jgi:hypothetical protein
MNLRREVKEKIKEEIVAGLAGFPEVQRVVETGSWIDYADENLDVAVLAFDHGEKYLKAMILPLKFSRCHNPKKARSLG